MFLKKLSTGDLVIQDGDLIKIEFVSKRNILSTCAYNGGYREDLVTVFNYDSSHNKTVMSEMKAPTLKEHMKLVAKEVGLNPQTSAGMCTAAQMKNVAFKEMNHQGVMVTAIVTGGIEENGGRAGDPASWYEKEGKYESVNLVSGTINIMLVIDARLSQAILASALMTATEAKVAAIQELLLPSKYSRGIATGSGTDKIIIIGNPSSQFELTDAGKHSKLGELIGTSVICAVKEALDKQTNANPESQHSVFKRMERFGVTKERIQLLLGQKKDYDKFSDKQWENRIEEVDQTAALVITASLYAHLLDQFEWGLIKGKEVCEAGERILSSLNLMDLINKDNQNKENKKELGYLIEIFEDRLVSHIYNTYLNNEDKQKKGE